MRNLSSDGCGRCTLCCAAAMIGGLDTHELVKDLKASGFTDTQAEAVTRAVRLAQDLDFSNVATKTDIAEHGLRLIKWVTGVGVSAAIAVGAMILTATQIVLRALPHV